MRVSLDLTADSRAAEAGRCNVGMETIIDGLAAQLPPGGEPRRRCQDVRSASTEVSMTEAAAWADLTLEQHLQRTEPMTNLQGLLIDDLTDEDGDLFFGILEDF